jgi:peptide methionine sulfoxide reductase MsrA
MRATGSASSPRETIAAVDASGIWPGEVVTEISQAGFFWEAEAEDQDYLQRYSDGDTSPFRGQTGSCHSTRPPPNPKFPPPGGTSA